MHLGEPLGLACRSSDSSLAVQSPPWLNAFLRGGGLGVLCSFFVALGGVVYTAFGMQYSSTFDLVRIWASLFSDWGQLLIPLCGLFALAMPQRHALTPPKPTRYFSYIPGFSYLRQIHFRMQQPSDLLRGFGEAKFSDAAEHFQSLAHAIEADTFDKYVQSDLEKELNGDKSLTKTPKNELDRLFEGLADDLGQA